jgi:4-amino-4-deoxy-L-arabinose transferase-like glycosyltransferase
MPSLSAAAPRHPFLSESARHQLLLVLLCAVAFLTNLGGTHLWDEDEAYFGSTAMEMVRRQDHVVPYFNGEISLHKPAFMYWVMMAGMRLFGSGEFAMRFGSVVFSTGTVLLTYHAARMLFTPQVGFWSAAALATCLQFMLVSRAAVSDPELVFFCTLSLVLFVAARCRRGDDGPPRSAARGDTGLSWLDWVLCYAAMGAAVLVKGPVGAVLPTAALGLALLFEHADVVTRERWGDRPPRRGLGPWLEWLSAALAPATIARTIWAMRPLTALVMVAAVAAPWYVWAGMRTQGEWPRGFLLVHNVGRFSRAFESHAGGLFYYVVAAAVGMFPWSMFLYQSVRGVAAGLAAEGRQRRAWQLLLATILVWIGVFTFSGTKLPHYVLAAYPALAIVCGAFVAGWVSREVESSRAWLRVSWGGLILVGFAVLVGGGIVLRIFLPGEMHLLSIGAVPLVGGLVGLWALETERRRLAGGTMLATATGFFLAILAWAAPQVSAHQNSPHVAAWMRSHATTDAPRLKSFAFFVESLVYYAGQPVEEFHDPRAVAEYFAAHPRDAFVVTTRTGLEALRPTLPEDVVALESMPRFLRRGEIVLLGRAAKTADAGRRSAGDQRR